MLLDEFDLVLGTTVAVLGDVVEGAEDAQQGEEGYAVVQNVQVVDCGQVIQ